MKTIFALMTYLSVIIQHLFNQRVNLEEIKLI